MKKSRFLAFLMSITLLVITGFQVYWLKNNYDREKRTLEIKTNIQFQDAVRRLQVSKLKIPFEDSEQNGKTRIFVDEDGPVDRQVHLRVLPKREIITMVNSLKDKLRDSLKKDTAVHPGVIISTNKNTFIPRPDTLEGKFEEKIIKTNGIFKYLYGVDSLQDSLKLPEIKSAYFESLKEANLSVPFTIERKDTASNIEEPDMSEVTVGFVHPITYHLELGNTFPYLMKKISLPILFSIFLVGVTVLSFVLLYRTLLRQQKLAGIKNEFISNITHELKTPIATVGVAIEALRNFNAMQDPQLTKEYLDISSNELQRLGLLVDKVLKLSMFEKKEIELKYETVNLKDIVDEVVASMRLQLEKYHAQITVIQEGNTTLEADRLHLLSVVFNLLDNALKYTKGFPAIRVSLVEKDQQVKMSVVDNGIGIAPEYKNKVFEKFFRVPTGNTQNARGYGLGLSYVAHVVNKHDGEISMDSQPGIGTGFTITIPKNHR